MLVALVPWDAPLSGSACAYRVAATLAGARRVALLDTATGLVSTAGGDGDGGVAALCWWSPTALATVRRAPAAGGSGAALALHVGARAAALPVRGSGDGGGGCSGGWGVGAVALAAMRPQGSLAVLVGGRRLLLYAVNDGAVVG